jgi:hypothetical protein
MTEREVQRVESQTSFATAWGILHADSIIQPDRRQTPLHWSHCSHKTLQHLVTFTKVEFQFWWKWPEFLLCVYIPNLFYFCLSRRVPTKIYILSCVHIYFKIICSSYKQLASIRGPPAPPFRGGTLQFGNLCSILTEPLHKDIFKRCTFNAIYKDNAAIICITA